MKHFLAFLFAASAFAAGPFELREVSPASLELREGGKPVFVYNHGMMLSNGAPETKRRSSYLHPIWAPNGVIVTDDFPKDHWHHRGIFWAWPIVNIDGKRHDQWMGMDPQTRFVRWIEKKTSAKDAVIAVENGWFLGDEKLVKETARITAHALKDGARVIDIELSFTAISKTIEIAGSPDNKKGYGGLSARFAPRQNTVVTTDKGKEAKDTDMVPHPWAQLAADYKDGHAALRIDDLASNPGAPNGWCLRNYGFLGVNFPGTQPYSLTPGKPLVLKYRVTITGQ